MHPRLTSARSERGVSGDAEQGPWVGQGSGRRSRDRTRESCCSAQADDEIEEKHRFSLISGAGCVAQQVSRGSEQTRGLLAMAGVTMTVDLMRAVERESN